MTKANLNLAQEAFKSLLVNVYSQITVHQVQLGTIKWIKVVFTNRMLKIITKGLVFLRPQLGTEDN